MEELSIFISIIPESIKIGLIYSIMAMGVYITYKILDFPDLTVDGSFPLGGFVFAAMSTTIIANSNPYISMIVVAIAGAIAGLLTGILHVYLGIDKLLSGILVMIGLYSINARIVGSPSVFIDSSTSIYGKITYDSHFSYFIILFIILLILKVLYDYNIKQNKYVIISILIYLSIFIALIYYVYYTEDISLMVTAFIVFVIKLIMDYILTSKFGFILRALGDNETIVTSLGVNDKVLKLYGLMIANSLVALSGGLFTQYIRVIDLSSSVGTMVIGLASIIFGLGIIKKSRVINHLSILVFGSILNYIVIIFALNSGDITNAVYSSLALSNSVINTLEVKPTDVKLITATLLAVILGFEYSKKNKKVK